MELRADKSFILIVLMTIFTACGGGGGGGGGGSGATGTGIESSAAKLSCTISIDQNEADINSVLETKCPNIFSITAKNTEATWSLADTNKCNFISINSSKSIQGVPNDNHVGTCSFIFNAQRGSQITVFTATIIIKNIAPTLSINDTSVVEDASMGIVRSDIEVSSSEEGFGLYSLDDSAVIGSKCSDTGTVSINSNTGEIQFAPQLNYVGSCNVGVRFDDGNSIDNDVFDQFAISVVAQNDAPVISGDCATSSLAQNIAFNCGSLIGSDAEGDTLTWSLDASNTCAWIAINSSSGALTGTANDDQVGTCNLAVKTNDGTTDSNIFSKNITVTNVAPVISALSTVQPIAEDATATVVLLDANVVSTEEGMGVYSLDNTNTTGTKCSDNGVVAINTTNGEVTFTPAADYAGSCNVRVVFDDQNASNNTHFQQAIINVSAVNDPAVITSACATSVNELAAYSCTGAYTDVESNPVTWSLNASNTCAWAAINPTTGNITGTPTRAQVGACDLVITANDGTANTDRTYNLTVNNLAPVVAVANTTLAEDAAATVIRGDGDVTSSDEGFGTYSIIAASSNDCQSNGSVVINASNGEVTFTPNANYDQACNINVQFNDGQGASNLGNAEFTVTMIPSPDNATVSLPAACNTDVAEDVAYSCTPTITDPDTGDTHAWSIDANTCTFISGITAATGVMAGTANDDQVGACSFTIKATGDQDTLVSSTLTANFSVTNVQPVITGTNPVDIFMHHTTAAPAYAAVVKNTASVFNVTSSDETYGVFALGTPSSDPCSAVADTHTINTTTGEVTFLPNDKYVGTCKIAIDFDDQNGVNNTATTYEYDVNVLDQVPPVILHIDSTTADGTYYLSQSVNVTVKFDEEIVVNTAGGSPRVFLETGVIDREAVYTGQSPDKTELIFTYTVQKDDAASDLEVHDTVSYLDLAGATVEDNSGNTLPNFAIPKPAAASGNSLSERRNIVIDGSVADASLTGLPTLVSPDLVLDVTVTGGGVAEYQYKVKQVGAANDTCADSVGYSGNINSATKITDTLVPFVLGQQIRICAVGVTAQGVVEPYADAFEYVWSKDANSIQRIDFGSVNNLPNWQDSEVDPDNNNIIYARNLLGDIYKSVDFGANWDKQCSLPVTYSTSMEVSPGPDRTPYAFQDGTVYKIVDVDGAPCTNLLSANAMNGVLVTGFGRRLIRFATNGDIYVVTDAFGGVQVHRSFDQGTNWSLYTTLAPATFNDDLGFAFDPNDVSHILYSKSSGTPDPTAGLYQSTDSGTTFTKIGPVRDNRLHWHPTNSNIVYRTYRAFSEKSVDGGTTWASSGEATSSSGSTYYHVRFDIDKITGHAYRLMNSGVDTLLQRATDITSVGNTVWSTIYTFNGITGVDTSSKNVTVSGNSSNSAEPTIVVNILNRMWTSSDGGTTFTERFAPEELKLLSIAGSGDDAIFGATKDWAVVKTADNGASWTYKTIDYYHCLGKAPRLQVNQLNPNNILMWTENYGTIDCDNFNYSVDAMDTMVARNDFSMVAPSVVVSMSPHNPKEYYLSGKPGSDTFRFHKTSNSAFETTIKYSGGNEFSDPMPDSFIHPNNNNIVWMANNSGTGLLYEYNLAEGTRTNITARTGLTSISALDVYTGDKGQYFFRVMDRTGRMKVSSDYGVTFVNEGTTGAPLTSCNKRFLYHHPKDRNLVVAACVQGDTVAISKDSGTTWDETDLQADYSINCNLTGIAVSSSRMYLGCENADTMIFNYSFASLENDVTDSILTTAENGNANDLLAHFFPTNYTTLEYAVIPASATCDGTVVGFSTTVPKSNDAAFTTRGEYKICIKQTDLASDISYTTTSTIFFDDGTPTFTSIDLINDVADNELTYIEHFNNNLLVGNLNSADHDFVKYAVVESSVTCNSSVNYSYEVPKSDDIAFTSNTTYKVCVELDTRGGATQVYGSSANITYVPTQVTAVISGTPEGYVSIDSALDVTISGTNVTQYMYKIINPAGSCEDSSGYSGATPIGTKITDSLTGYSSGDNLTLCVMGGDASGYFQAAERATQHKWVYSTNYRVDPIDFSSINTMSDWRQVAIHSTNQNLVYALNTMGEIWKSEDQGSNWNLQCRISLYQQNMHLKVSPGADGTAYVSRFYTTSGGSRISRLYRVDALNGYNCKLITGEFRGEFETEFVHTTFSINSSGVLYHLEDQYDSLVIRKSSDYGRSWTFVSQLQDSGLKGQLYINPQDENIMLLNTIKANTGSGTTGLYRSTDAGTTWSFVQSTGFTTEQNIYFDPVVANRVYANNQYISTDNGSSWTTDAQFDSSGGRWLVDNNGKGYRLEQLASDTVLYRSNGLNPASFTSHYVFSGIQSSNILRDNVSATGNTIAVIIGTRMFISTNAGVSFTEKFWPGENLRVKGIASTDGEKIYAVAKSWNVLSSNDKASNWSFHTQYYNPSCENDARVFSHHLDKDNAWVYSDHCHIRGIGTDDGFTSFNKFGGSGVTGYDFGFFINTTYPNRYVMIDANGNYTFYKTLDTWASNTSVNDLYSQFSSYSEFDGPLAYSKVFNPDTYLFIHSSNTLREARLENDVDIANINSRLTFTDPAAITVEIDKDRLNINHVVISQNGKLNISTDDAKTFSSFGTTSTGLTTCEERLNYIYPNNNKMMVTACNKGTELAWTLDRGASWTRIDLSSYFGMTCNITGIIMNDAEIMFSCYSGYDGMRFFYTPADLLAGAEDNLLTAGEVTGANIVKIDYPAEYSTIEYAVITSGATCNGATPGFSTTVPVDSDISGLGDGSYQICLKLDNGSTVYKTSTEIKYDGSAPSFASIDLVNEAVDGIQLTDYLETSNVIVNNISGANYDNALYSLVSAATTCDGSLNYKSTIPRANSDFFTVEGSYKVCVALVDGVNAPAYGASNSFNFSKQQVIATLSGEPTKISADLALNITVGGSNVDAYQYKVGAAPLDCTISAGYSSEILVGTLITDNISGIPNGNVDLCVRGIDNTNHEDQTFYQATKYSWQKTNVNINFASYNVNNYSRNWFDVEVAKWNNLPHIYARDFEGNIFLSTDRGSNFTLQCKVPHDTASRISLPPKKGHGAFATANGKLYRIDALNGENCPSVSDLFTAVVSTFQRNPVAFNSQGEIYAIDQVSATQSDLYKSNTLGESWTLVHTFNENLTNLTINIDPFNDNNFFLVYEGTSSSYSGDYIISKNGGESFIGVRPSSPGTNVSIIQNVKIDFKFDPANYGYMYANNGYYSNDNLDDFTDGTGNYVDDFARWDIDNSGVGYRLVQSGANIDFEKSNNMTTVSFSVDKTISSVTAGVEDRTVSVSFDGSTVAVVADKKMYVSLDNGAFSEVFTPVVHMQVSGITSEDNSTVYLSDYSWNILKSTNGSASWSYADTFIAGCSKKPRIRTSKANANYVIAYAEDNTGSCESTYTTTNGFASAQARAASFDTGSMPSLAMDPTDENAISFIANGVIRDSADFFVTPANTSVTSIVNDNHAIDAYMSNLNNNLMYNVVGAKLYEVDKVGSSKTDITASLVMANPAGIEGFPDGTVYVMSQTGQIDISSNSAGSFSAYSANPSLVSCNSRILKALAANPGNIIATACNGSNKVAYTLNGGTSWTEVNLADYTSTSSCTVRDMAIVNDGVNKMYIACDGLESIYLEMN